MLLDSNVLLDRLLDRNIQTRQYSEQALEAGGGIVTSAVLTEVFAVYEREQRLKGKEMHGSYSKEIAKWDRLQLQKTLKQMVEFGEIEIQDAVAAAALDMMPMYGLDYTDCLLGCMASIDATDVATSDKELVGILGTKHWQP